jgi:hypothetical protein
MFGPIARSRIGPQNVCTSCLAILLRPDFTRFHDTRKLSSTSKLNTNAATENSRETLTPDVLAFSIKPKKAVKDVEKRPSVASNQPEKVNDGGNESALASKPRKRKRRSTKLPKDEEDSSINIEQKIISDSPGATQVDTVAASHSKHPKKNSKSAKVKKSNTTKAAKTLTIRKTKRTLVRKTMSSSHPDDTPLEESQAIKGDDPKPGIGLVRRAQIEAKTPDLQRLITKSHMLWLNKKGGLSDSDKLQIMEHLRRSIEDNTLEDVVSFTKEGRPATTKTRKITSSRTEKSAISTDKIEGQPLISPRVVKPLPKRSSLVGYEIKTIEASQLKLVPVEKVQPAVPKLSYGLDRVLFNPGVYHLRDPRSRVFNFDPYLQSILPVDKFNFDALKEYITSSRDTTLISTAAAEKKKYTGSTSSMTSALAHFHFLLSQWRPISTANLSQSFPNDSKLFTKLQRAPSAVFLRWKNGTYAIDADKEFDSANVLLMLGKSMEKLLTLPMEEFEKYRIENYDQISEEERNQPESYHYTTMGDFLMRSQLDAYDERLPGTGMFDLKTRAVVSIRKDVLDVKSGLGYEIRGRHGEFESYEREYYDMIRSAFLKYSLQVRMGRMDGIFVAFHNTERIFGFQYISLSEMDEALHGTDDVTTGDAEFKISLELLNRALDRATAKWPEQSLRLHFDTRAGTAPFMYIFAEPMSESEIDKIQQTNKVAIEEYERKVLKIAHIPKVQDQQERATWQTLKAKVEEEMKIDELGIEEQFEDSDHVSVEDGLALTSDPVPKEVERRVEELLSGMDLNDNEQNAKLEDDTFVTDEQGLADCLRSIDEDSEGITNVSGNPRVTSQFLMQNPYGDSNLNQEVAADIDLQDLQEDGAAIKKFLVEGDNLTENGAVTHNHSLEKQNLGTPIAKKNDLKGKKELLAMTLTIRNKVNGDYVERPLGLTPEDEWNVEYALADVPQDKAQVLYEASQKRRAQSLNTQRDENNHFVATDFYSRAVHKFTQKGRKWREEQDKIDAVEPLKVLQDSRCGATETGLSTGTTQSLQKEDL